MPTTTQTASLDQEISQLQQELAGLKQELADLDERGIYRVQLENGQTLEAQISGDELRFDNDTLLQTMGLQTQTAGTQGADNETPAPRQKYLPYALIGGGAVVLLFILMIGGGALLRTMRAKDTPAAGELPPATAVPTATPMPTVTPTPSLLPADFIGRAPILLGLPSLGLQWPVTKGDWTVDGDQITLSAEGDQVRYYNSFVGIGNTVLGGNGTTPADPFYTLRSADINDVLVITDRGQRQFYFRLLPFGGDRVERWITPADTWVVAPTDQAVLTIIIRVAEKRMALRALMYGSSLEDD